MVQYFCVYVVCRQSLYCRIGQLQYFVYHHETKVLDAETYVTCELRRADVLPDFNTTALLRLLSSIAQMYWSLTTVIVPIGTADVVHCGLKQERACSEELWPFCIGTLVQSLARVLPVLVIVPRAQCRLDGHLTMSVHRLI